MPVLELTRQQILGFRRRVGALDERLPPGARSLRHAAWAGLQDSMPRAALLSIHARVKGAHPQIWDDRSLVGVWGPRYSTFVVPARDYAIFTLGRYPDDARGQRVAEDTAAHVREILDGRTITDREVGIGNRIRYATLTGTVQIRWEGARAPLVWMVPRPQIDPRAARLELARRYLHVYGPTTPASFAKWAGIGAAAARDAFDALELLPVRTPIGEAWLLAGDEAAMRADPQPPAPVRLLPSGDAYWLLQGVERELLVPDVKQRAELWTPRVWPGALLVGGEIAGTWRRDQGKLAVSQWRKLTKAERQAVEDEAASLPLPGIDRVVCEW